MTVATELELRAGRFELASESQGRTLLAELEEHELGARARTRQRIRTWSTSTRPSTKHSSTTLLPWPTAADAPKRCAASPWSQLVRRSRAKLGPGRSSKARGRIGRTARVSLASSKERMNSSSRRRRRDWPICLAMMEHEGHAAAEAANEQEAAEHFLPLIGLAAKFVLPKLAGLAAKKLGGAALKKIGGRVIGRVGGQLLRRAAPRLIRRASPQLTRGLANVARTLYRNRSTRPLLHAVPRIARTTVARLGRQVASGQRITPQSAARTLAQQTARTLSNPRVLAQTYRRSVALDRRYHRRTRRVLGRPVGAPVRAANDTGAWGGGAARWSALFDQLCRRRSRPDSGACGGPRRSRAAVAAHRRSRLRRRRCRWPCRNPDRRARLADADLEFVNPMLCDPPMTAAARNFRATGCRSPQWRIEWPTSATQPVLEPWIRAQALNLARHTTACATLLARNSAPARRRLRKATWRR